MIAVLLVATPPTPKRIILKELGSADAWVCAEYTAPAAPRVAHRSCLSVADVRDFILRVGTPNECP